MYIVYVHTNMLNGKQYVGLSSTSIEDRAGKNATKYKNCKYFWRAIQKYGWDNFTHVVLVDNLTHEQAMELEKYYIHQLNTMYPNGYNLTSGGDSGWQMTETVKLKISEALKGNKNRIGHKNSEETNKKTSRRMMHNTYCCGRKYSESTKTLLREHQPNRVEVNQYTKTGEYVASYLSVVEAGKKTGIHPNNIRAVIKGRISSAGGYVWSRRGQ